MTKDEVMTPRKDAIEVLLYLRSQGYRTGLISNASIETTIIWEDTPLSPLIDEAVFSCLVRLMKPDPRIYYIVTEQLAVEPQNCLYIADGIGQELTGASQVGMHPVLIRVPYEDSTDPNLIHREDWKDPTISSLKEVISLLA